jgi:hypothetical protein
MGTKMGNFGIFAISLKKWHPILGYMGLLCFFEDKNQAYDGEMLKV